MARSGGMSIRMDVSNLEHVKEALLKLSGTVRGKIVRKSTTAGGKIIKARLKDIVPQDTKLLYKSIGDKVVVYRTSSVGVAIIGPRRGFDRVFQVRVVRKGVAQTFDVRYDPIHYFHLVLGGRKEVHPIKKRVMASAQQIYGKRAKSVTGRPVLAKAVDASRDEVENVIAYITESELEQLGSS